MPLQIGNQARYLAIIALPAVLLAVLAIAIGQPAFSQPMPVMNAYEISHVEVDVTASTAAIARDIAVRQGQRKALEILLERLTIEEDRLRIPTLDDTSVAALVLSIQFENERYSSTRYISKLTINFNQEGVRRLLDISGATFSETMARAILVLPSYQNSGLSFDWEEADNWLDIWREADWRSSLVPFILPEDGQAVAPVVQGGADEETLAYNTQLLADLYGTSETLVVTARDSIDLFTGAPRVEVTTIRRGVDEKLVKDYVFAQGDSEEPEAFLTRITQAIGQEISHDWKSQTLISLDQMATLQAEVSISTLADWVQMKDQLQQVPVVKDVLLNEISISKAVLTLNYLGTQAQLSATLRQYGIGMESTEQHWKLLFQ